MEHYQFEFEKTSQSNTEMLIAMLNNIGFEGFEEADDQLNAFIKTDLFEQNLFDNIIEHIIVKYSKSIIKEVNWNEKWEAGFEPVIVPDAVTGLAFASVRADFHQPVKNVVYELIITPKMSFGTGHHATTYLVIQQMGLLNFTGRHVIDFGTGTGVLAILAEKMGASGICAIDHDDWSINNARENVEANGCTRISLVKAETIDVDKKAAIILANINLNIIIENIEAIKGAAAPGAEILFSGIMVPDKKQITDALEHGGFFIKHCVTKDNWLAILAIL